MNAYERNDIFWLYLFTDVWTRQAHLCLSWIYWREIGLWQAKQTKNNQTAIIRSQRVAIASLLLR